MSRRLTAAALAALFAFSTAAHAKPRCNTPEEVGSMQFRQLQIELMVASLKCGGGEYDYRAQYASYMRKAGPGLARNADELRTMFVRQGKGAGYLDRYLTSMSNDAQMRSQTKAQYCETNATILDHIAELKASEIPGYAAEVIGTPYGARACSARTEAHHAKAVKKAAGKAEKAG